MEYLSKLIHQACDNNSWSPFLVGRGKLPISHLLFADDIILFGETDSETLFALKNTLAMFSAISGQSVNVEKSKLFFSPNTPSHVTTFFEETLSISSTKDLGLYLGFPLSPLKPSKSKVQFIVNKIRGKLASWKTSCLSKAGRLCLIKSTLNTIPNYYMSTISLPKSTLTEIDSIISNFLWGDTETKKNIHLVAWSHISRPLKVGGLGIRASADMNVAHMVKLCWKSLNIPSLASKVLKAKYIAHRPNTWNFKRGSHIWTGLGKGWDTFINSKCWTLGDGTRARFWEDDWLGTGKLISFIHGPLPLLEQNCTVRHFWTGDKWNFDSSGLIFFTPPYLINLILSIKCRPLGTHDTPYSSFAPRGSFDLSLAYSALITPLPRDLDLTWIWKIPTYPKIQFFIWLSFWDRLPHKATLATRGMNVSPYCYHCPTTMEHTIHILRDCPKAISLWNTFSIDHNFFSLDLKSWLSTNLRETPPPSTPHPNANPPWPTLFSFCIWHLWLRRNEATFKKSFPPLYLWKPKLLAQAWEFSTSSPTKTHHHHHPTIHCQPPDPPDPIATQPPDPPDPTATHLPGWVTLHSDGSWSSLDFSAGLGGFFKGPNSAWKLGFQRKASTKDALYAEGLALFEGLQVAWSKGWTHLTAYTDSKNLINMITATQQPPTNVYTNLINDCRGLITRMDEVKLIYRPRRNNRTADALAKHARLHLTIDDYCTILEAPPPYCMKFLCNNSSSMNHHPCNPYHGNLNSSP